MKLRTPAVMASAMAALALTGPVAGAQEPVPDVTVKVTPRAATVSGAEALRAGPTRFVLSSTGKAERGVIIVRLRDGLTRRRATKLAPRIQSPAQGEHRLGRFVSSALLARGQQYATTTDLAPGEYAVLDITKRPVIRNGFTVADEPSAALMPATSASIIASDYRFSLPDGLPQAGPFLIENRGNELHHVLAFPIKRKVRPRRVVRSLLRDRPRGLRGAPSAVTELISGGTANAVEGQFRKGRILLVCFLRDGRGEPTHAELGMFKAVRVR